MTLSLCSFGGRLRDSPSLCTHIVLTMTSNLLEEFYDEEILDLSKILSWIESQKEFVPNKESLPTYSLKLKKAIQAFNNENHKRCVETSRDSNLGDLWP